MDRLIGLSGLARGMLSFLSEVEEKGGIVDIRGAKAKEKEKILRSVEN